MTLSLIKMTTTQKSKFFQIRLEPELLAVVHQMAEEKNRTASSLVRDLIYLEAGRFEVERKKGELRRNEMEEKKEIPSPDSFQLETTPSAPAKQAQKPKLGRKERRLKEARDRKFERMEIAEERKKASPH